jgi:hypothetical protein
MCRTIQKFFTSRCLWGVALLALTAALPGQAWAQAQHGVGITKNCVDPRGGEPGVVLRGETVTNNITVFNLDTAGHAIRVDSITDAISNVNSGNLLAAPVTLPALGNNTQVSFQYTVQASDPLGALTDTASTAGVDLGNGLAVTASAQATCTVVECIVDTDCTPTDAACGVVACVNNACVVQPVGASTICRPAAGDCDVAESCDGINTTCPADGFSTASTICRAAAGDCDVAESCTGSTATCPADGFSTASTICRAAAGDCDVAESCTGSSASCPADGFQPASTSCNVDLCQSCPGNSASCPTTNLCQGGQGCTPGFFKGNADNKGANAWGTAPNTPLTQVFTIPSCLSGCGFESLTLRQALSLGGGNDVCGKARNLLRIGTGSYLNAISSCVEFDKTADQVVAEVNAALASCTGGTITSKGSELDRLNNQGCPIDQQGRCTND